MFVFERVIWNEARLWTPSVRSNVSGPDCATEDKEKAMAAGGPFRSV